MPGGMTNTTWHVIWDNRHWCLGRKAPSALADTVHSGGYRCMLRGWLAVTVLSEAHLYNRESEVLVPVHLAVVRRAVVRLSWPVTGSK